jgi:hypothetical protein
VGNNKAGVVRDISMWGIISLYDNYLNPDKMVE